MNRRAWSLVGLGVVTLLAAEPLAQSGSAGWDARFREMPQTSNIRASMERLSARPHHVGSPYDKENAEWILARFKEWGWDAEIEGFNVLFPTPKERLLALVEPTRATRCPRRAAAARRSDLEPEGRAVADLQRLFDRRRCHRPARLRQLRTAR